MRHCVWPSSTPDCRMKPNERARKAGVIVSVPLPSLMLPALLSNNTCASSRRPHCYSGPHNERPVVPGRLTGPATGVCLFIGGCQDVAQTATWFKRGGGIGERRRPDCGDGCNQTFKGCSFPFSTYKMFPVLGGWRKHISWSQLSDSHPQITDADASRFL